MTDRAEAERVAQELCERYHGDPGPCDQCNRNADALLAQHQAGFDAGLREQKRLTLKARWASCATRFVPVPVDGCECDPCMMYRMEEEQGDRCMAQGYCSFHTGDGR